MNINAKANRIVLVMVLVTVGLLGILLSRSLLKGDAYIMNTRETGNYQIVSSASYRESASKEAPLGIVKSYRFLLNESMCPATHLAFYTIHQYVDVYVGEEHVYSLQPNPQIGIKTVGSNWTMLPLYPEDFGKEITVYLTPVYEVYRDFNIEFLVGSGLAIYTNQLARDLPQLIVCGLCIACGLFLAIFGIVWHFRKHNSGIMVPLGVSAICVGIWRLFDTVFSPFMAVENPILLFSTSIAMLMMSIIPLVITLHNPVTDSFRKPFAVYFSAASAILLLQMLLQVLGVLDLRDTLYVTHVLIVAGAMLVIANKVHRHRAIPQVQRTRAMKVVSVLLVLGALTDLAIYYILGNSSNLLITLMTFVIFVIFSGIELLVVHNKTKKELVEKEKQLMDVRITMMFSQIRSHFIFNILNAISGMCKYDPLKADETIINFARYLRTNIETIYNDQLIPFRSSLHQLEDYVVLEQVRFQDKIRFVTDISVDNFLIPPLMLQPIVENAIRHGITPKDNGGTILLKSYAAGDRVCVIVRDDGVGFHPEALRNAESTALKNVQFRLQHMIGGTLEIESRIGHGTTVTMMIPWKETDTCE